jgi:hypothetical protein
MKEAPDCLLAFQRWMMGALTHPEHVAAEQCAQHLKPAPRQGAAQRLQIYQRSYFARLTSSLAEQYPGLCHALGAELFDDFVQQYLRAHPPASHTLHDIGRQLPEWLEHTRPDRDMDSQEGWIDFLVDLARFERASFELFDAPGSEDQVLPTADTPDEQLYLQPSVVLAEYRYAVASYHHEVRAGRRPTFPEPRLAAVALVRRDYRITTLPLERVHLLFLKELRERETLDAAVGAVARAVERPVDEVWRSWRGQLRAAWMEVGLFGWLAPHAAGFSSSQTG